MPAATTFSASPFAPRKPATASATSGPTTSAAPAPTTDHAEGPPLVVQPSLVSAITPSTTLTANIIGTTAVVSGGGTSVAPQDDSDANRRHIRNSINSTATTAPFAPTNAALHTDEQSHVSKQPIASSFDSRRMSGDRPVAAIANSSGSSRSNSTVSSNAGSTGPKGNAPSAVTPDAPQDESTTEQERKSAAAAVAAAAFGGSSPFALGGQSATSQSGIPPPSAEASAMSRDTRYVQQHHPPPAAARGVYPTQGTYTTAANAPGSFSSALKSTSTTGSTAYVSTAASPYSGEHAEGPWTKEEIIGLLQGMMVHGRRWRLLTNCIGTRTSSQVRQKGLSIMSKLNRHFGLQLSTVTSRSSNDLHPMLQDILKQQQHHFDGLVQAIEPTILPGETTPQSTAASSANVDSRVLSIAKSVFTTPQVPLINGPNIPVGTPQTLQPLSIPPQRHPGSNPPHHHVSVTPVPHPHVTAAPPAAVRDSSNDKGEPGWERRVQEVNALNKGALAPWSNAYVFPNSSQVAQNITNTMNIRKRKVREKDQAGSSGVRHDIYHDGAKRVKGDGGERARQTSAPSGDHTSAVSPHESDDEKSKFFADLFDQEPSSEQGNTARRNGGTAAAPAGGGYGGGAYYDDEDASGDCRMARAYEQDMSDDDYFPLGGELYPSTVRERQRSAARRTAHRRRSEARRRVHTEVRADPYSEGGCSSSGAYPRAYNYDNARVLSDDGHRAALGGSSNPAFRRVGADLPESVGAAALRRGQTSTPQYSGEAVRPSTAPGLFRSRAESEAAVPSALDDHSTRLMAAAEGLTSSQCGSLLSGSLLQALEAALGEVQDVNKDRTAVGSTTAAIVSKNATTNSSSADVSQNDAQLATISPPAALDTKFDSRASVAAAWGILNVSLGLLTGGVDAQTFLWSACRASATAAAAMVEASHNGVCTGTVPPKDTTATADKDVAADAEAIADSPTAGLTKSAAAAVGDADTASTAGPVAAPAAVVARGGVEQSVGSSTTAAPSSTAASSIAAGAVPRSTAAVVEVGPTVGTKVEAASAAEE